MTAFLLAICRSGWRTRSQAGIFPIIKS
jgi:hypothetical protein